MRPKARGLAQHGAAAHLGGWRGDPHLWFCMWWTGRTACMPFSYRTGCPDMSCPAKCWWNFQQLLHTMVNVHNHPSWAASRKEGMAWYSSRPLPSQFSESASPQHPASISRYTYGDRLGLICPSFSSPWCLQPVNLRIHFRANTNINKLPPWSLRVRGPSRFRRQLFYVNLKRW